MIDDRFIERGVDMSFERGRCYYIFILFLYLQINFVHVAECFFNFKSTHLSTTNLWLMYKWFIILFKIKYIKNGHRIMIIVTKLIDYYS